MGVYVEIHQARNRLIRPTEQEPSIYENDISTTYQSTEIVLNSNLDIKLLFIHNYFSLPSRVLNLGSPVSKYLKLMTYQCATMLLHILRSCSFRTGLISYFGFPFFILFSLTECLMCYIDPFHLPL